jgi:hypothetical protein
MEQDKNLVELNADNDYDKSVNSVESYVLNDVSPEYTYQNPDIYKALKFESTKVDVHPKVTKVSQSSPQMATTVLGNQKERSIFDKTVRVFDAFSQGAGERSSLEIDNSELFYKQMMSDAPVNQLGIAPDAFTDDDKQKLIDTTLKLRSLPDYSENFIEDISGAVGSGLGTIAKNAKERAPLIIGSTALGGVIGFNAGGVGAVPGAATGFKLSSTAAIIEKSYKQATGSMYGQLLEEIPNADKAEIKQISQATGMVNAALDALLTKGIAKLTPGVKDLYITKKVAAKIATNKTAMATVAALGKVAVDHGSNGMIEMAQEMTSIIGERYAKGESLDPVTIFEDPDIQYRLAKSGAAGTATSGVIAGSGKAVAKTYTELKNLGESGAIGKGDKKPTFTIRGQKEDVQKIARFDLHQRAMINAREALKTSELKNKSSVVYDDIMSDLHGDQNVYVHSDKVKQIIADDRTKAENFTKITGVELPTDDSIFPVSRDKFFKLLDSDEQMLDAQSETPDAPLSSHIDDYLNKIDANKKKAAELESKIDEVNDPKEKASIINQLAQLEEVKLDEFGSVEDYVNQPVIPDSVRAALPETVVSKLEQDVRTVRKEVADTEIEIEKKKIGKFVRLDVEVQKEVEIQELKEDLKNYKAYDTIDAFMNPNAGITEFDLLLNDGKPRTTSKYAINPETVPTKFKNLTDSKKLKKYKVFDKNGIDAVESAQLLGYQSVDDMFNDLTLAEPRQKVIDDMVEERTAELKAVSEEEIGFRDSDITEVLSRQARMHLKELSTLMDGYKSTVKEGFKRAALPLRSLDDLKIKAVEIGSALKVRELNAKTFEVNEKRMNNRAVTLFNKGDIYGTMKNKENAALNALVRAEVYKINRKLNRNIKKIAKLANKESMKVLSDAGPIYQDAFSDITDVISFNRKTDDKTKQSYLNWLEDQESNLDHQIPSKYLDTRQSVNDLSAQAALALSETALAIHDTARKKSKLIAKRDFINEQVTIADVANTVNAKLANRPDYKASRFETADIRQDESGVTRLAKATDTFIGAHIRVEKTIFDTILDHKDPSKYFTKTFWEPAEYGRIYESNIKSNTEDYIKSAIETYGKKEFFNLGYTEINDPDLIATRAFSKTKVTKLDVLTIALNMGNAGNIDAVSKTLKMTEDKVFRVLSRHLTEKDWDLVQKHWDSFDGSLWEENVNTLKEVGDSIPEKVEPKAFSVGGKKYKGGFYPIATKRNQLSWDRINMKGLNQIQKEAKYKASIMTINSHNIEREGFNSGSMLNFDYSVYSKAVNEITHDIAFRAPLRDIGQLLGNESIQKDIYNVLGETNYGALVGWVESLADKPKETSGYQDVGRKIISKFLTGFQLSTLGYNIGTALIQPTSTIPVWDRFTKDHVSPLGALVDVSQDYIRSLTNFTAMRSSVLNSVVAEIAKVSPDFRNRMKQLDVVSQGAEFDNTPKTGNKTLNNIIDTNNKMAFYGLTQINLRMNAATWVTAKRLADAGKIKGIKAGDQAAAINYANSVIRTELESNDIMDKSAAQRQEGVIKLFTQFYSQMNVITNKFIQAGYDAKLDWMDTTDMSVSDKIKHRTIISAKLANAFLVNAVLPAAYIGAIRGVLKGEEEEKEWSDYLKGGAYQVADSFLGLRDFTYFMQNDMKRTPSIPLYGFIGDVYIAGNAAIDLAWSPVDFEFSNKQMKSVVRTLGAFNVPAKPAKYLYDLATGEDLTNLDFGANVFDVIENITNDVGFPTEEGAIQQINDDATSMIDEVDGNKKELLETVKKATEVTSKFENPEGDEVYLADVNKTQTFSESEKASVKVFMRIASFAESNNDPNAYHSDGAAGRWQFKPGTWRPLSKQYPELGLGDTPPYGEDSDKAQNKAMWKLTAKNYYRLEKEQITPSFTNLYSLHILGETDGIPVLQAGERSKALSIISKDALLSNPMALLGVTGTGARNLDLSKVTIKQVRSNIKNYIKTYGVDRMIDNMGLAKEQKVAAIQKLTTRL